MSKGVRAGIGRRRLVKTTMLAVCGMCSLWYGSTTAASAAEAGGTPAKPAPQTVMPGSQLKIVSEVPILAYHDIGSVPGNPWVMSREQFVEEMMFLARHNFHPITMNQLYTAIETKTPLPARPVVISFDDGYDSVYAQAYPVLKQYGFSAVVFMVSGFIGRPGFLTPHQLQEMQSSGLIQFGAHTTTHVNLKAESPDIAKMEIEDAKQALSHELNVDIRYFSYPYGAYGQQTMDWVQKSGYLLAVTSNPGYAKLNGNPFALNRIPLHSGLSSAAFAQLLAHSLKD